MNVSGAQQAARGRGFRRRFGGGGTQDFELNLASIIDCMVVLIAFVLASASFVSIGILDAGVAAAGATSPAGDPPPVSVVIDVNADRTLGIRLTGAVRSSERIAPRGGERDYAALAERLARIKARFPTLEAATLQADNDVDYKEVVRSMDVTRKSLPSVLLGGF